MHLCLLPPFASPLPPHFLTLIHLHPSSLHLLCPPILFFPALLLPPSPYFHFFCTIYGCPPVLKSSPPPPPNILLCFTMPPTPCMTYPPPLPHLPSSPLISAFLNHLWTLFCVNLYYISCIHACTSYLTSNTENVTAFLRCNRLLG